MCLYENDENIEMKKKFYLNFKIIIVVCIFCYIEYILYWNFVSFKFYYLDVCVIYFRDLYKYKCLGDMYLNFGRV